MAAGGVVQPQHEIGAFPRGLPRALERRLPPDWQFFGAAEPHAERLTSHYGAVEIREVPAGFVAETCVKGTSTITLKTGLRRLTNYVGGDNRGRIRLRTCRPVTQCPDTTGRWRIRVMLRGVMSTEVAAIARNGKVRLHAVSAATMAITRVPGQPAAASMALGESAIVAALLGTNWVVTGGAMARLHSLPRPRLLGGWFEVALPVSEFRFA